VEVGLLIWLQFAQPQSRMQRTRSACLIRSAYHEVGPGRTVVKKQKVHVVPMTDQACPRCKALAVAGRIRAETVQRLPEGACAPMGLNRQKECFDCASAETLLRMGVIGRGTMDDQAFEMARIAVGNDRQEQYRAPGLPLGLVQAKLMRPSAPGDFEEQLAWLKRQDWYEGTMG
jgi:hypothetical protein